MRKPSKDKAANDEPEFPGGRARERVEQFRRSRGLGEVPSPGRPPAEKSKSKPGRKPAK
jgi:hypothetical protein